MKAIFIANSTAYVVEAGFTEAQIKGTVSSHQAALHALVLTSKEVKKELIELTLQGINCPDLESL